MSEKTTTTQESAPQEPASAREAEAAQETAASSAEATAESASRAETGPTAPPQSLVPDAQLAAQQELALGALRGLVPADQIGEGHRVRAEGELVVTHLFPAAKRGYRGWEWYVTLARVPGSEQATICESGMLPGDDALLAPEWVPWSERKIDSEERRSDPASSEDGADEHEPVEDEAAEQASDQDVSAERSSDGEQEAAGSDPAP